MGIPSRARTGSCVYRYVLSSSLTVGKVVERTKTLCRFTNTKVNLLQHFFSHRKKETAFKKLSVCVSWTKRTTGNKGRDSERERERWREREREREQTQTLNFPGFLCVRWFRLHSCTSGVRPLLGAHSKIGFVVFVSSIPLAGVQLTSLPLRVQLLTPFSIPDCHLLLPSSGGRTISVSTGSKPARKIWDRLFSKSFLINVVIHPWLTDEPSDLAWVTAESLCFLHSLLSQN